MKHAQAEVAFGGSLEAIRAFYEPLGVQTTAGGLRFDAFEVVFGAAPKGEAFQIAIETDRSLAEVEQHATELGGRVIDEGVDLSGPYLILIDPAGLRLRVGLTLAGLMRQASVR